MRPGTCLGGRVVKVDDCSFGTFSTVYWYVEDGRREFKVTMEVWSVDEGRGVEAVVVQEDGVEVMLRYIMVKESGRGDLR